MPWWLDTLWVLCELVMFGSVCLVIRAMPMRLLGSALAVAYLCLMGKRWWKFLKLGEPENDRETNVE